MELSNFKRGMNKIYRIRKKAKAAKERANYSITVKWAIIGLGNMGEHFASALECVPEAEIIAVASRTYEKAKTFASKHSVPNAYGSYEEMLRDKKIKIDVVYIATPHRFHFENIKLCLDLGKNVICEKPVTSSAVELKFLIELAKEKNVFFMEGMWTKCLPTYLKAKEWIERDLIGKIKYIRVDLSKKEIIDVNRTIFDKNNGGGVLQDYGIYPLSFACALLGNNVEIESKFSHIGPTGVDSNWFITLKNGIQKAFLSISSEFEGNKKASIVGDKGSILFQAPFNRTNSIQLLDRLGNIVEEFDAKYIYEGFEYEIEEVNKCIQKGKLESEKVSLKESLVVLNIIDQLLCR